jgi:tetratricopeptide (TPR) repeat protein
MLGITRDEADLMLTFTLSLKMKNYRKIIEHFKDKFEQDPDNIENAFNYGACMSAYMLIDRADFTKANHLFAMNQAFTKCLEQKSAWWLVRYLRSELNTGLPIEATGNKIPALKQAKPEEDLKILLEQQNSAAEKFPYFLCPYMSQTRNLIIKGKIDEAREFYQLGLAEVKIEKSPVYLPYLTWPFFDTVIYFRKLNMQDIADEIKKHSLTLFPNAKNLLNA